MEKLSAAASAAAMPAADMSIVGRTTTSTPARPTATAAQANGPARSRKTKAPMAETQSGIVIRTEVTMPTESRERAKIRATGIRRAACREREWKDALDSGVGVT